MQREEREIEREEWKEKREKQTGERDRQRGVNERQIYGKEDRYGKIKRKNRKRRETFLGPMFL